jgi:hypothetical protein
VAGKNISEIAEEERRHWTTAAKIVKEPDVAEYVKDVRARFFENDDRDTRLSHSPNLACVPSTWCKNALVQPEPPAQT